MKNEGKFPEKFIFLQRLSSGQYAPPPAGRYAPLLEPVCHLLFYLQIALLQMPRKITGKPERRLWTADKMTQAVTAVKHGMSRNQAARVHGIPKRTLRRYLEKQSETAGKPEQVKLNPLGSFKPVFTVEQEQQLVNYAIEMGESFYGLSAREMRSLAFQMAQKNGIPHPFDAELKLAGPDWMKGFLQRHPALTMRAPENTSLARARGFNRESVGKFFNLLERINEEHEYPPSRIWNLDETGVSTVSKICSF